MRDVSSQSCRESKTHILRSTTFPENRPVYEILWKSDGGAREAAEGKMAARCMLD
jgi:hypothetical protein